MLKMKMKKMRRIRLRMEKKKIPTSVMMTQMNRINIFEGHQTHLQHHKLIIMEILIFYQDQYEMKIELTSYLDQDSFFMMEDILL